VVWRSEGFRPDALKTSTKDMLIYCVTINSVVLSGSDGGSGGGSGGGNGKGGSGRYCVVVVAVVVLSGGGGGDGRGDGGTAW